MTQSLPTRSFLHALGVVVYVALVAIVMHFGSRFFGKEDTYLTGVAVLLLLCVSAATVGGLVFGTPAVWFLSGKRREGILLAVWTVGWMALAAILAMATLALTNG